MLHALCERGLRAIDFGSRIQPSQIILGACMHGSLFGQSSSHDHQMCVCQKNFSTLVSIFLQRQWRDDFWDHHIFSKSSNSVTFATTTTSCSLFISPGDASRRRDVGFNWLQNTANFSHEFRKGCPKFHKTWKKLD